MLEWRKGNVGQQEVAGRAVEEAVGDRKRAPRGRVASTQDPELVEVPLQVHLQVSYFADTTRHRTPARRAVARRRPRPRPRECAEIAR